MRSGQAWRLPPAEKRAPGAPSDEVLALVVALERRLKPDRPWAGLRELVCAGAQAVVSLHVREAKRRLVQPVRRIQP